jgi:septum formation protein
MTLILASKSSARQNMLRAAGLEFETRPAEIDESAAQSSKASPSEIAQELARE